MYHRISLLACALALTPFDLSAQRKLTTLFAWDNGLTAPGAGAFFDLQVLPPGGVYVTALETNTVDALHAPLSIDVYRTPNTHVGNEGNAGVWTKVTSGNANSATVDIPTAVTFPTFFHLPQGTWGIAVYHVLGSIRYTNGTGSNQTYSNADLKLTAGTARSALFSGTHFNPRVWNGSIYYGVTNNPPSFVKYGAGCAGSAGTPTLSAQPTFEPKLGTGFNFSLTSLPAGAGPISLLLGASRLNYAGLTLPYDLSVIGMTACRLYAGADLVLFGVNIGGGTGLASVLIPSSTALLGQAVYAQAFVPDATGNQFGATMTNAAQLLLGQ
jgi:hypothetical protein